MIKSLMSTSLPRTSDLCFQWFLGLDIPQSHRSYLSTHHFPRILQVQSQLALCIRLLPKAHSRALDLNALPFSHVTPQMQVPAKQQRTLQFLRGTSLLWTYSHTNSLPLHSPKRSRFSHHSETQSPSLTETDARYWAEFPSRLKYSGSSSSQSTSLF